MDLELKIVGHIKKNIANEQEENDQFDLPEESRIIEKIEKLKSMPAEVLAVFFEAKTEMFTSVDWANVLRTLREEVLVKYDPGKGLIDDSEDYDKQWFSKVKITEKFDNYYSNRFSECYKEKLGPQVRYTLSRDTESILNLCGSPKRETVRHIRGLVFGFVQSGKTLNYASVSNAAMGAGYDMIVVLAGATNILREQTQKRLNHDLIGQYDGKTIGVGKYDNVAAKKPISLTTPDTDFNTKEANAQTNGINLENIRVPVIAVIKKNVTPLKNLKEWLEKQAGPGGVLKKSLLLIDDESDYASVNTNEEEDPTSINRGIRDLLNSFDVSTYLAVTATPFANILIDHEVTSKEYGADLFPRSFIWTLDKPETYIGVIETLGDSFVDVYELDNDMDEERVKEELRFVLTAKKEQRFEELPYYVKYAVCRFLYDATCLRRERPKTEHLSMMVNISRLTDHHVEISSLIQEFTDDLFKIVRNSSLSRINNKWLLNIKELAEADLNSFTTLEEFWKELEVAMGMTEIFDIHQRTKVLLSYPEGMKRNSILVGGLSLSRGYTIEGLITSVFIRTTKTFDALMQMGRWFGHKKHILKHISVFTTPTIRNRFELIEESVVDLLEQIDEMKRLKLAPRDFGLNIRRHPNVIIEAAVRELRSRQGLEVVSRSKRKSAQEITLKLSLGNRIMETVRFLNDKESAFQNDTLVKLLINNLNRSEECNKYSPSAYPGLHTDIQDKESILGYLDVPNSFIKDFMVSFKLPNQRLSDTNAKLPLKFLLEFIEKPENQDLRWDVSLVTGGVKEQLIELLGRDWKKVKRSLEIAKDGKSIKLPKNQLSIPAHEYRFLSGEYKEMVDRSIAREKRKAQTGKPMLLLFPIKPEEAKSEKLNLEAFDNLPLWGWSISMPGNRNNDDYVSVLANSVLMKELMEDYEEEIENEDN
jgi:hypothetical protein